MADVGRPSKYDPAFCDEAVSFLKQGYSTTALAGHLKVSRSTLYKWADEHEAFSDALKTGQAMSAVWWEDRLRDVARGRDGNATAAIFGLKNRAAEDWREKVLNEHSGPDGGPIETVAHDAEQFASRITRLAAAKADQGGTGEAKAGDEG